VDLVQYILKAKIFSYAPRKKQAFFPLYRRKRGYNKKNTISWLCQALLRLTLRFESGDTQVTSSVAQSPSTEANSRLALRCHFTHARKVPNSNYIREWAILRVSVILFRSRDNRSNPIEDISRTAYILSCLVAVHAWGKASASWILQCPQAITTGSTFHIFSTFHPTD
jgi:hypothetical protein